MDQSFSVDIEKTFCVHPCGNVFLNVHITLFSNVFKLSLKDPVLYWLGCLEAVQRFHQLQGTTYLVDTCDSGIPTGQVFKLSIPNRTNEQVFDTHH